MSATRSGLGSSFGAPSAFHLTGDLYASPRRSGDAPPSRRLRPPEGGQSGAKYGNPAGDANRLLRQGVIMVGILIGILLAALVFWLCTALGLPVIVGVIAAVLVLLAAAPLSGVGRGRV